MVPEDPQLSSQLQLMRMEIIKQIHIHSANLTSFVVSVKFSSQRTVNGVKTMETERIKRTVTAVATQLLSTRKGN